VAELDPEVEVRPADVVAVDDTLPPPAAPTTASMPPHCDRSLTVMTLRAIVAFSVVGPVVDAEIALEQPNAPPVSVSTLSVATSVAVP
jgi:hypothetical protein